MNNSSKTILILADAPKANRLAFVDLVSKNFKNENTKIELGFFNDLSFTFSEGEISVRLGDNPITKYDLVYIRKAGKDYSILANSLALSLKHLKRPFFDTLYESFGPRGNKLTSLIRLSISGMPLPTSIYFCKTNISDEYDYIARELGVPFVSKDITMQRGNGVFLIHSREELEKLPKISGVNNSSVYLFQKLIQKEHEYRMLVLKDKVGVWEEKIATIENEFRNNVALGAKEIFLDIKDMPSHLSEIAIHAAIALKIEVAGVDVITEKVTGKAYILEVNRGPGLTYDEKVSYEFKALAEFFENEVWKDKV